MESTLEYIKAIYITEEELAGFLGVEPTRVRDLRSHHATGKQKFINHIKPTSKITLYHRKDVLAWLENQPIISFGKNKENSGEDESET